MKRTFTTICVAMLAFINGTSAQTFTFSTFSSALATTANVNIADLASFNVSLTTTTGSGVTWNASGLVQQGGTPTIHFQNVIASTAPHGSVFPGATTCEYDPALLAIITENYFVISADSMVQVGEWSPNDAHEIFMDPDKRFIFPFSYGNSFNDAYSKTNYSDSTTVSSVQSGTRNVQFNGFGTLILPQGTFDNVALISELRTNSLGPNSTYFTWYDLDDGKRLMYYSTNVSSVAAYTIDMPTTGIEDEEENHLLLYPNPATNQVTIQIPSNEEATALKLITMAGKEIYNINAMGSKITIDLTSFTPGIYIVKLSTQNREYVKRLIID